MAISRTATYTATYPRMELIKLQIKRVLVRSGVDEGGVKSVLSGIEKRWISEVSVYVLDAGGDCYFELSIKVDWKRNEIHLSAGRDIVEVDSSWKNGISAEVDLSLGTFEKFVRERRLRKEVRVRYAPGVDRDKVNRILGFTPAAPVRWRGGTVGTAMSIPELDEVTVEIKGVENL